jgi:hypothetical protein
MAIIPQSGGVLLMVGTLPRQSAFPATARVKADVANLVALALHKKEWGKNSQRSVQPEVLPVDFRSPPAAIAQSN